MGDKFQKITRFQLTDEYCRIMNVSITIYIYINIDDLIEKLNKILRCFAYADDVVITYEYYVELQNVLNIIENQIIKNKIQLKGVIIESLI